MKVSNSYTNITGNVKIYSNNILVYNSNNLICEGIKEMLVYNLSGTKDATTTHIYGQYGNTYTEGGGPYFTPNITDTVSTMMGSIAKAPITYKPISGNTLTNISIFTGYSPNVFIGAGLVSRFNNKEILIAHISFPGVLARTSHDLLIAWDLVFDI